ncbi:MAG: molecular chaperone TorD family protein [Candidatus Binatia bacterium]|nr:molecular chaperone TorD family protein [Candidatus Binatia bacterium]
MAELCELLQAVGASAEASETPVLVAEYLRVFDRTSPCSPREGSWTQQAVSGRPALIADIAGFYAAFGVQLGSALSDTEDRIAAELEFSAFLALKLAYAAATGEQQGAEVVHAALRSFWCDHVGRFVLPFARA